jgi:hypothetical protein
MRSSTVLDRFVLFNVDMVSGGSKSGLCTVTFDVVELFESLPSSGAGVGGTAKYFGEIVSYTVCSLVNKILFK